MRQAVCYLTHLINDDVNNEITKLKEACYNLDYDLIVMVDHDQCSLQDMRITGVSYCCFTINSLMQCGYNLIREVIETNEGVSTVKPYSWHANDIVLLAWYAHIQRASYHYMWLLEYDVRFSGEWEDFFSRFDPWPQDLISLDMNKQQPNDSWVWWDSLQTPKNAIRCCAILPIFRLSKLAITVLETVRKSSAWYGHHEAIIPSAIQTFGLTHHNFGDFGNHKTIKTHPHWTQTPKSPDILWHPVKPERAVS